MDSASVAPRKLMPLHILEEITNGFSKDRKLGAGSYGTVYKGEQKDGEKVAVKMLHDNLGLDDEQFEKEYNNIASLHHKNIVQLVGYCHETRREVVPYDGRMIFADRTKRALCFEYIHNGTLQDYLSDESNGLDWPTRYAIIKGISEGLKYLHEDLESPMYHLDLKPANVLLDEVMVPKIADFGLSRLFGGEGTQMTKSRKGTPGYVPPEYIDAGIISSKFDIFSLGVIIIRIMTGPKGYFRSAEMPSQRFVGLVHENWKNRLHATSHSEQVKRCIEIAISCVEADRHKRPSIGAIINKLNETESINKLNESESTNSRKHIEPYKMCSCISTLLDIQLNNLFAYTMHVIGHSGKKHEVTIMTACQPYSTTTFKPIRPAIKIIDCTEDYWSLMVAIDVHPTEPWILTGHYGGYASIWNHETQARVMAVDIIGIIERGRKVIYAARFIAREHWFVVGDVEGYMHVHTYKTDDKKLKTKIKAHASYVSSLAVHPSLPFVLSASGDHLIKLWNWKKSWECIQTFEGHSRSVEDVRFNPQTSSNTFASASMDCTVKIWSLFSPTPIATLDCDLVVHITVDYFLPNGDRQYLVTGSDPGTAKIWDLRTNTCIAKIEGLQQTITGNIAVVDGPQDLPILVTASKDKVVSFCDSTNHRHENRVDFKLGLVSHYAYSKVTNSLVVLCQEGIAIMEIN